MNTYWVYDNIKKQTSFYTKLDVLLLLCSGVLWKKHHPSSTTFLFCDDLTLQLLEKLQATSIWDKVDLVKPINDINKDVFWAASKVNQLKYVNEPTVLLDHDFLVYRPLDVYLNSTPVFAHDENGERYYLTEYDKVIKKASDIILRPKPYAINCSFMYFPNSSFANSYATKSIDLMKRFTQHNAPNSKYLIFAEQLTLKNMLDNNNIKYNTLINERWRSGDLIFEPNDKGIFSFEDSLQYFRHYWFDKNKIKNSIKGFSYKEEVRILCNILSPLKHLKLQYLNDFKQ